MLATVRLTRPVFDRTATSHRKCGYARSASRKPALDRVAYCRSFIGVLPASIGITPTVHPGRRSGDEPVELDRDAVRVVGDHQVGVRRLDDRPVLDTERVEMRDPLVEFRPARAAEGEVVHPHA
jgi:hypothetical protein